MEGEYYPTRFLIARKSVVLFLPPVCAAGLSFCPDDLYNKTFFAFTGVLPGVPLPYPTGLTLALCKGLNSLFYFDHVFTNDESNHQAKRGRKGTPPSLA